MVLREITKIGDALSRCRSASRSHLPSGRQVDLASFAAASIGTDKAGVASLRFHDQSKFDVGPSSSVKLNKFIYDPNRSSGKAVFDAAKGSFRFTTGAQGGGGTHQIKTPYGTLGIRG
jgi:hypothetical protein